MVVGFCVVVVVVLGLAVVVFSAVFFTLGFSVTTFFLSSCSPVNSFH